MLDLDHFIADCRAALGKASPELAIRELLERAVADPSQVEAAVGPPRLGQIAPLHQSAELSIFNVVWPPGMSIFPHDHRMWALIGLYGGREDNTFYRRTVGGLATAGGKQIEAREATLLGKAIIHSVTNPLRSFTGAIHIYGGDFVNTPRSQWAADTFEEGPYDMGDTRRAFAEANERWRAACAAAAMPTRE